MFVLCGESITRHTFCKQSPRISSHRTAARDFLPQDLYRFRLSMVDEIEDAVADSVIARHELSCRESVYFHYEGRD